MTALNRLAQLSSSRWNRVDWTKKANEILERSGGQDVSSTGEASADFSKSDRPMPRAS